MSMTKAEAFLIGEFARRLTGRRFSSEQARKFMAHPELIPDALRLWQKKAIGLVPQGMGLVKLCGLVGGKAGYLAEFNPHDKRVLVGTEEVPGLSSGIVDLLFFSGGIPVYTRRRGDIFSLELHWGKECIEQDNHAIVAAMDGGGKPLVHLVKGGVHHVRWGLEPVPTRPEYGVRGVTFTHGKPLHAQPDGKGKLDIFHAGTKICDIVDRGQDTFFVRKGMVHSMAVESTNEKGVEAMAYCGDQKTSNAQAFVVKYILGQHGENIFLKMETNGNGNPLHTLQWGGSETVLHPCVVEFVPASNGREFYSSVIWNGKRAVYHPGVQPATFDHAAGLYEKDGVIGFVGVRGRKMYHVTLPVVA